MQIDYTKYSDAALLESFESVNREKYPGNYQNIKNELEKRGIKVDDSMKKQLDETWPERDRYEYGLLRLKLLLLFAALGLIAGLVYKIIEFFSKP